MSPELRARRGGVDGRVQGVPVQAAATLPQHRPRRPHRAEGRPHATPLQVVQVVHGGRRVRPPEDLPDGRAAQLRRRRGAFAAEFATVETWNFSSSFDGRSGFATMPIPASVSAIPASVSAIPE